jgi:chromosome segregation ATPase/tetrahydromethanopterin S-methyltransferase subunit G
VTTLEDAAEELVVRLKGLDSEIEESQDEFEELRGRLEEVTRDVEEEWAHLAEVAESFLAKVQGEQEAMGTDVEAALQALGDAGRVLKEHGAEARGEIAEARSSVDLLAQRATGLEPGIESLVAEGNEASLADLAQRAEEVERDLEQVVADTRAYLQGNLVAALEEMADAVRARCAAVRESLADRTAQALQVAFEKWEERVDQLEEYVATQAFVASHAHARTVVDRAMEDCASACRTQLAALRTRADETAAPLAALAASLTAGADALAQRGTDLNAELTDLGASAAAATAALDAVRGVLARYTFAGA